MSRLLKGLLQPAPLCSLLRSFECAPVPVVVQRAFLRLTVGLIAYNVLSHSFYGRLPNYWLNDGPATED